ncbi:hypothetical protein AAVH_36306 [Aphelenchoides avenae]|nr:hypothetical protein AAVH_36306 [Aphelenchus avenae]
MNQGLVESGHTYINRHPAFKFLSYVRTVVGIVTVFVIFSAAVDSILSISAAPIGIYLLVVDVPVFLLEFGRIIRLCCGTNGALCRVFGFVLHFDRWKRAVLYVLFAIVCFLPSVTTTYARIAGIFLVCTGILYFLKVFQKKKVPLYAVDSNASTAVPSNNSFQQP